MSTTIPLSAMTARRCEACGGEDQEPIHRQHFLFPGLAQPVHYDVVACRGCGFAFASDIPDQSALDRFYRDSGHHLHAELPPGLQRIHAEFFRFVQQHAGLAPDAPIRDIGSGMGHFLSHFQAAGFRSLQGVEPSQAAVDLADRVYGLQVHASTIDSFAPSTPFALVTLCGVLEHIADLRHSIRKVSALLGDGGLVFLAVPDAPTFGRTAPTEPFLEFALEHINFFSATSLDNLMRAAGFEQVAVTSQHNDFYDNSYLLALYRKTAGTRAGRVRDEATAPSLRAYVELSRQELRPVEALAAQLVASREPLLIWGAGGLTSRLLCDTCLGQANIIAIVDRNTDLHGRQLMGVPIEAPDSIRARPGMTVLIASTTYATEIRAMLKERYAWQGRIISLDPGADA